MEASHFSMNEMWLCCLHFFFLNHLLNFFLHLNVSEMWLLQQPKTSIQHEALS